MKNTIFFDSNFNFTLLENEENPDNSIYIKFHTSDAANQVLNILANASTITESLASNTDIVYELEQTNWTNNGATVIWLSNDDISSPKVKIIFSEIPTASCAINRGTNTVFVMQYEGQTEEESGGSGSGGSGNAGSAFDFVETIRNIGFRLLDEPSDVSVEYDEINNRVEIKWKDPADIATNEPAPAEWAGTVVVKKSGSAPLHKWDGTIVADSTTRDEYSVNALIDNDIDTSATYYYGIFPYDTKGDYRYTKVVKAFAAEIPAPEITGLSPATTSILVNYSVSNDYTWDHITLVYKKGSAPADKTDGTAVSLSASDTSIDITGLDAETTYYFKIFAQVQGSSTELESNVESTTTGEEIRINVIVNDVDYSHQSAIIRTGTMGVYDDNTNSFYFSGRCDWSYSGLTFSKNTIKQWTKLIVEFEAKVTSESYGQSGDLEIYFTGGSSYVLDCVAANGYYDHGVSHGDQIIKLNGPQGDPDFADEWGGLAPLETLANIGSFHNVKFEVNLSNGTATTASVYCDNTLWGTHTFNYSLMLNHDNYTLQFDTIDHSNIRSIKVTTE